MTIDEVLEIDAHCKERKVSRAAHLRELGLSQNLYYNARRRYFDANKDRHHDPKATEISSVQQQSGSFLPIQFSQKSKRSRSQRKQDQQLANGNTLLIEMRTSSGTELRIQGQINIKMLKEIIHASGGGSSDV